MYFHLHYIPINPCKWAFKYTNVESWDSTFNFMVHQAIKWLIDWLKKNLYCPRGAICLTTAVGTIKHIDRNTDYWLSVVGNIPFKITTFELCELRTCFNHPEAVNFKRNCIKKKKNLVKNSLPHTVPSCDDLDKLHIHGHLPLLRSFFLGKVVMKWSH